ncbi:alkaline phosphatase isoform X2 [Procambarus clarkii]
MARPRSLITVASRPRSLITVASRPRSLITVASRPRSLITVASRPRSLITVASRPRSLITVGWTLLLTAAIASGQSDKLEGRQHWWNLAQNDLAAALSVRDNWNVAKNVVVFVGDGLGVTANTAARIFKGQKQGRSGEEGYLVWDRFPNTALLKTYNVDKQVPDSAATATAFLCGIKGNYYTLGVDPSVTQGDCAASKNPAFHTSSILQWAQEAGKDTGIVTTTRVTHATPAAAYAHSADRDWECDSNLGKKGAGCKDIGAQLITEAPGRNIKVILGGGRQALGASHGVDNNSSCSRRDGRDLTKEWLNDKFTRGLTARYVTTSGELDRVDPRHTEYLLGLFDDSHLPYEIDRLVGASGSPSLKDMTVKALRFLRKNRNGFFLLVEGGRIDHALHDNQPHRALEDTLAMDSAVAAALKEIDLEETLLVVTADHSHVMTINGYPDRGNDILGISGDISKVDGLPYTTLMFTNGPGYNYTVNRNQVRRPDPRLINTKHPDYRFLAAVPTPPNEETHGGEDVAVWAVGPMAHLFHRTHEQNYVAHVMAYASCVGPSLNRCERPAHASFTRGPVPAAKPPPPRPRPAAVHVAAPAVTATAFRTSGGLPKFPTLSPVLQQLLNDNEQKIVTALGTESVKSFSATSDVRQLLGRNVVLPHGQ